VELSAHGWVLIGPSVFVATSAIVGVRLLRLARRTNGTPDRAAGVALISAGAIGYTLIGGVPLIPGISVTDMHLAVALGDLAVDVACVALCLSSWRVSRPDRVWAAALFAAVVATLGGTAMANLWTASFTLAYHERPWWHALGLGCQCFSFAWASVEALLSHARLRRQARATGTPPPAAATRSLMWGIATGSAALLVALYAIAWQRQGSLVPSPQTISVLSVPGMIAAVCVWLAFLPPRLWRSARAPHSALRPDRAA
jgi:hypothetical protein